MRNTFILLAMVLCVVYAENDCFNPLRNDALNPLGIGEGGKLDDVATAGASPVCKTLAAKKQCCSEGKFTDLENNMANLISEIESERTKKNNAWLKAYEEEATDDKIEKVADLVGEGYLLQYEAV